LVSVKRFGEKRGRKEKNRKGILKID